MNTRRGEVVLADLPYSDRSGSKKRPALVVQCDRNNKRLRRRDPGHDYQRDPTCRYRTDATVGRYHDACARVAGRAFLLTTDDLIVKRICETWGVAVMDPTQFVIEVQ